jgi:hypothetical protein
MSSTLRDASVGDRPRPDNERERWSPLRNAVASPARVTLLAVLVALAIVVVVRLGSSLIGLTSLSGVDALGSFAPWRERWTAPTVQNTWVGDTIDVFLPGYLQMFGSLWSGDLPLWSSLSGPGTALLSSPNIPTLALPTLPLLLTPTVWAVGFAKLIQLVMIVGGMMLWLRRVGATWVAGAFAGLVYCGSGFFVAWSGWTAQASVAATIPLLFWAVEYFIAKRSIAGGLLLSVVVGWLLLGGFPAVAGHALYAAGVYFVVRVLAGRPGWRHGVGTIGWGALAVAGGLALSAIQLLPFAAMLAETDTAYRANQFHVQLPNGSAFTMFFPRLFLPHDDVAHSFRPTNPIEAYSFVGMGAVALAVLALLAGRRSGIVRGVVPTLAVTGLLAAAVVWQQGLWTNWMADLPVFASNPSPRLRDLVALTGSALAGLGLNLLFRTDLPDSARRRLTISAWVIAGVAVFGTVGVALRYSPVLDPATFPIDAALALVAVALVAIAITAAWPRPARTAAPAARFRWSRRDRLMTAATVLLVAVTGTQVLTSTAYFWPVSDSDDFYPMTPAVAAAQGVTDSGRAAVIGTFPGSTAGAYGIRTVTGHTFQPPTWRDLLLGIDEKAYTPPGRTPTYPVLGVSLTDGSLANPLFDRLAVGSVLVNPDQSVPGPVLKLDGRPSDPLGEAAGAVPVGSSGAQSTGTLEPTALRGFIVPLVQPVGDGQHGVEVAVTVRDSADAIVAAGSSVRLQWPAGWHQIAVAGEELDNLDGPLSVDIAVRSQTDPELQVMVGAVDGGPDVRIIGSRDDNLVLRYADSQMMVWQRLSALPRVRWSDEAIVVTEPADRIAALQNPATPRSAVVLSEQGPNPSGATADIAVGTDTGDEVSVDVSAAGDGYLVLADAIQMGWTVTIDGQPATLVDADHAFGAVLVPEGRHQVTFSYNPASWRLGVAITGCAIVVFAGLLGYAWYRRRRRQGGVIPGQDDGPAAGANYVTHGMSGSQRPPGQAG